MNTHADKTQEPRNLSVTNKSSQKKSKGNTPFQFADNRPETAVQRKLSEMANNNQQVRQLKSFQKKANIDNSDSLEKKPVTQLNSNAGALMNTNAVIQRTDDNHTTLGPNPALWTAQQREDVQKNIYRRLTAAKARALAIAKAYAARNGAPDAVADCNLGDFEITQRGQTGTGRIPVEQVYEVIQGQIASSGRDNRRKWIITIDIDDPPYAPGGQRPHVGYTVEVRTIGANAVAVDRDIGHVWLDAVPAGRGALGGVNIWG